MKSTFKVLFYLKKGSEKKNGEVMIMARITIDGKLCQFSTKQSILPENWNIAAGKAKGYREAMAELLKEIIIFAPSNFSRMDIWDKKKRSAVMAKIKGKDTKPEWIVRRYLFSRGYRYLKNVKGLPGTPDIVLRKYGIVIFIHGCFWHGHGVDGHIPHSNSEYWRKKIGRNKQRDERDKAELKRMGWHVMTVWECQLKPAVRQQTLLEIEYHINHTYLERFKQQTVVPYDLGGNEEQASGMVAEGEVEYGK